MRKLIVVFLLSALFVSVIFAEHVHTFDPDWSYNSYYHWHLSNCEHIYEVDSISEHQFGNWQSKTYYGQTIEFQKCAVCGFENYKDNTFSPLFSAESWWSDYSIIDVWPSRNLGGTIKIPTTVNNLKPTILKQESFMNNEGITGIIIPSSSSLEEIGYDCFKGCTNLTNVILSSSLKEIGSGAFEDCVNLKYILIPDSVEELGGAFRGCSSLRVIILPSSINEIENGTFKDCKSLIYVEIPEKVRKIGYSAFSGCSSLIQVDIPKNVWAIGNDCFNYCPNLQAIYVDPDNPYFSSVSGCLFSGDYSSMIRVPSGLEGRIAIPDIVTTIEEYAFMDCAYIYSISIPSSVSTIGENAFSGCSGLSEITIPDSIVEINRYAFSGCTNLSTVSLSHNAIRIGACAFSNCTSLEEVIIPESVQYIMENAFSNCTSLKSVSLPENLIYIQGRAFSGCSNLETINYAGATYQWRALQKGSNWNKGVPAKYIQCSDGIIEL